MIFCPQCGFQIPDSDRTEDIKFCPECGCKLPEMDEQEATEVKSTEIQQEISEEAEPEKDEKQKKKQGQAIRYIVMGLGVGLLVVLAIFAVVFFTGLGNEDEDDFPTIISQANEELKDKWNGSWYGVLYIRSADGTLSQLEYESLDVFMVVSASNDGSGEYAIFVDGSEKAIASGICTLRQNGLYTKSGKFCDVEVSNDDWVLLASKEDAERFTMSDEVETSEGKIAFALSLKKWGNVWDNNDGTSLSIVPKSINAYNEMLTRGAASPYTVNGIDRSVWSSLEGTEQMSWDDLIEEKETEKAGAEPKAIGDGVMDSQESFWALIKWINSLDQTTMHTECTYEKVREVSGIEGKDDGNHGATSVSTQGDHYIYFYNPTQTMYLCLKFRAAEEGADWCLAEFSYYGFSADDIPS